MGQTQTTAKLFGWWHGAPEHLPQLQDVEVLSPIAIRVLGQNPGPATLQGTNTYILGQGAERVLVDASDGNSNWWPLLSGVLLEHGIQLTAVIITHRHYDHTGGLAKVQEAFPGLTIWKGPSPEGAEIAAGGGAEAAIAAPIPAVAAAAEVRDHAAGAIPPPPPPPPPPAPVVEATGSCVPRRQRREAPREPRRKLLMKRRRCWCDGELPIGCKTLTDGQELQLEGAVLRAVYTPGHTDDSICLVLQPERRSVMGAILTGDTVLGGSTGVFDDLRAYEGSLRWLQGSVASQPAALYPGHGAVVDARAAPNYLRSMLSMLEAREKAVLKALLDAPGGCSVGDVCTGLYGNGINATMARDIIEMHLEMLVAKGKVSERPGWMLGDKSYELASARSASAADM